MIDSKAMGLRQRTHHGDHVMEKIAWCEVTLLHEKIAQGKSIDIFHDDKDGLGATFIPPLVLDGDDIGVGERCDRLGFADKSVYKLFIVGQVRMHDLDRYKSIEAQVGCLIN